MDKAYRESHPEESFDGGYHLWAQEQHKARVSALERELEALKDG